MATSIPGRESVGGAWSSREDEEEEKEEVGQSGGHLSVDRSSGSGREEDGSLQDHECVGPGCEETPQGFS